MDMTATLISGGAGLLAAVLFGILGARPFDPRRGPRLIPYRPLMILSAVWVLLMLVHLANLAGLRTGR